MSFGAVCFCSYACESSYCELSEVSLNVCFMHFFYSCIYRDAQSGSHGRWDVVAGQHQSNGLLQSELRPSQLETSYSTAEDQPNGRLSSTSVSPSSFWVFNLNFLSTFLSRSFLFLILLFTPAWFLLYYKCLCLFSTGRSSLWATGPVWLMTSSTWRGGFSLLHTESFRAWNLLYRSI